MKARYTVTFETTDDAKSLRGEVLDKAAAEGEPAEAAGEGHAAAPEEPAVLEPRT